MQELKEKNKQLQQYLKKTIIKRLLNPGRPAAIFDAFIAYMTDRYQTGTPDDQSFQDFISKLTQGSARIGAVLQEPAAARFLGMVLPEDSARQMARIWERSIDYPYSQGYMRRPFRTKTSMFLLLDQCVECLVLRVVLHARGIGLPDILSGKWDLSGYHRISSNLIALELDDGNEKLFEQIRQIVNGQTADGPMMRAILHGLMMCHDQRAHKLVGDLLLAAKLQEGLRQTVVESMDEGCRESFVYLLHLILEHDMLRFSSVVRALDVWTGLGIQAEKPSAVKKCMEAGLACLQDKSKIGEYIGSGDSLLIYIALWAAAFDEVNDIIPLFRTLLASGERRKRLCALYFLRQTQLPAFQRKTAESLLNERDEEILAWAVDNLFAEKSISPYIYGYPPGDEPTLRGNADEAASRTFSLLLPLAKGLPQKEIVFQGSVFPWASIVLSASTVLEKMLIAIAGSANDGQIDELAGLIDKMNADTRHAFVRRFLKAPGTPLQKQTLVKAMGDRSPGVRGAASEVISKLSLSGADYRIIENLLSYKSGDLRKNAMSLLLKMPSDELVGCIGRLAHSGDEIKRLAAIELAHAMEKAESHKAAFAAAAALVVTLPAATQKEKMHAHTFTAEEPVKLDAAHGFGLYDPNRHYTPASLTPASSSEIKRILYSNEKQARELCRALTNAVEQYKDYEYEFEGWDNARKKRLLGNGEPISPVFGSSKDSSDEQLEDLPLADVWINIYERFSPEQILFAAFCICDLVGYGYKGTQWYIDLLKSLFPIGSMESVCDYTAKLPHTIAVHELVMLFRKRLGKDAFPLSSEVCRYLLEQVPLSQFTLQYQAETRYVMSYGGDQPILVNSPLFEFWLESLHTSVHDDTSFAEYFSIAYRFFEASQYKAGPLNLADYGRALSLGIIDENEAFAQLLGRPVSPEMIADATNTHRNVHDQASAWPQLMKCAEDALHVILRVETRRGELPTEVSPIAAKVRKCHGMQHFVSILLNAEKDTYVRGYAFLWGEFTRRDILSHLLRALYPLPGEDETTLRSLLQGKRVTEKQLIDAAMYSPQWIDIVEKYLGWEGLKSACWYFHAHVNEGFTLEKEAIVSRFSPIEPQDFKDGAFDINWFRDAYNALGPQRLQLVYDSAKYIAGGSQHKRSQLFADAITGKLVLDELEKQIEASRNKDRLLAYSLIPQHGREDLLRRYRIIQLYAKQAKQFGAQRQAAETRTAKIALENLARNAGYTDANRLIWSMETESLDEVRSFFAPRLVEDVAVSIALDEQGAPSLLLQKDGKELKDVPAKLKKNPFIEESKAILKQLKEQRQRARASLEAAMVNADGFTPAELDNLERNPVLAPMLHTLVFRSGDRFGMLSGGKLEDVSGELWTPGEGDILEIAHPVNLYREGVWADYQKLLFDRQIVQPFRQVFRELYLPNEDELLEGTISRRYAGHQVQPRKAAALLKTRGWTANPEEGLQKVLHRQNVVVEILALADWLSPADVESPTIEGVRFLNRKTWEPLKMGELPAALFSEAMRDMDLAVSVAHAGGVDPEASHSTIEMRTAIIQNLLPLMKLENVRLKGSHALITGHFGEYSVHLGSGITHMMARGEISILPVHSQHRGRLFLPFVDDDPKTAEILSKIVLLAEDKKIKDPSILSQIEGEKRII